MVHIAQLIKLVEKLHANFRASLPPIPSPSSMVFSDLFMRPFILADIYPWWVETHDYSIGF